MADCNNCFDEDSKSIENSRFIFQNSDNTMFQNQVIEILRHQTVSAP